MEFGEGGDLATNLNLSPWLIGCHSSIDLKTTITGDIALTKDYAENNRQRLIMWMALPKGERINSGLGCCLHDYFHEKITSNVSVRLKNDIEQDMKSVFPELNIKNIVIKRISTLSGGNREIVVSINLGDDNLQFLADWNNIMSVNEEMNSILYTGGARVG